MTEIKIPTKEECFDVFVRFKTPNNVIEHSLAVNTVAVFLAKRLKEKGEKINVELVDRASLLHDFARPVDFRSVREYPNHKLDPQFKEKAEDIKAWNALFKKHFPENQKIHVHHNVANDILCEEYGYPEVGEIIRHHKFFAMINEDLDNWEEKIVYYADMRVRSSDIVTLKDRFDDFDVRYGKHNSDDVKPMVEEVKKRTIKFEKELFAILGINPEEIDIMIQKEETY